MLFPHCNLALLYINITALFTHIACNGNYDISISCCSRPGQSSSPFETSGQSIGGIAHSTSIGMGNYLAKLFASNPSIGTVCIHPSSIFKTSNTLPQHLQYKDDACHLEVINYGFLTLLQQFCMLTNTLHNFNTLVTLYKHMYL